MLSGGHECVLLKWTHVTGAFDTKPRLGSPICAIAVSPDGSFYATCHADNCKSIFTLITPHFAFYFVSKVFILIIFLFCSYSSSEQLFRHQTTATRTRFVIHKMSTSGPSHVRSAHARSRYERKTRSSPVLRRPQRRAAL